jgi:hypothetical protein
MKRLDDCYKDPFGFPIKVRLLDGNRIDCSSSAVPARWRRLGILSLAPLDRVIDRIWTETSLVSK